MKKVKVFIVDDHYMVIEGIKTLLATEKDIELVGHASNAASCLAFIHQQEPDVILMDISMPDTTGIELCQQVKQQYPGIFVIGLSTFNQYTFIDAMMEAGASGYLLKNAGLPEIREAVMAAAQGKIYMSDDAAQVVRSTMAMQQQAPIITRREIEVLRLIADGYTNPEIAAKLFLSTSTVDTHRKSLMRKLEVKNTALLIRYAVQHQII